MLLIERFLAAYGIEGAVLTAAGLLLFVVQVARYVRLGRLAAYTNNRRRAVREAEPPVSVIVPLFSEDYAFLEERLPLLLQQEYRQFEVVLVYVGQSSEFYEDLLGLRQCYAHLYFSRIHLDPRRPISRKMALNIGIKAAHNECLLFTSSDAAPRSPRWLALMAKGFVRGDVVIGYCGLEGGRGLVNRLMRTGRMMRSADWISRAVLGRPHRGILHNFGFTKSLYFDKRVNGFNRLNMNIGEDDLFLQEVASRENVSTILSPKATVEQHAWGGLGWWLREESYYGAATRFYPRQVRWSNRLEPLVRVAFFAVVAWACVRMPLPFALAAAGLLLLRYLIVLFEVRRIARRLGERRMLRLYFLYDLASPLWGLVLGLRMLRKDPRVWR